ncbi:MAG TPA: NAD-dependent epimerase/dehydratase family protein, partial [Candidatus Omnitrophota bacterium]|nr:NAD-dependent epimerase/dehydratase family protein [Candidatus Omnitrophota bacterium]
MAKKNVLITGGAGFVGSNLAVHLEENEPEYNIVCFDNLKRHGSEHNLERLKEHGIRFVHGDIRNKEDFSEAGKFDIMIECSAEQSVPSGHDGSPQYMINTNLTGAINCFEAARSNNAVTIFLSSGRIYPMDVINGLSYYEKSTRYELKSPQKIAGVSSNGFSEQFPINGVRSMYGATKIAAEFLLKEYIHAYGMKGVINRCGVTTGPWQTGKADQGFAVLWVASHM